MAVGRVVRTEIIEREGDTVLEVVVDQGGGEELTLESYSPAGVDARPVVGDYASIEPSHRTSGRAVATGFIDPIAELEAVEGEWSATGRSGPGAVVCRIRLKPDGTVAISNANGVVSLAPNGRLTAAVQSASITAGGGSFELDAGGDCTINGTVFKAGGLVDCLSLQASVDVRAAAVSLLAHNHGGVTSGGSNTGPPNPS